MKHIIRILVTRLPILLTTVAVVGLILNNSLTQPIVRPSSSANPRTSVATQALNLENHQPGAAQTTVDEKLANVGSAGTATVTDAVSPTSAPTGTSAPVPGSAGPAISDQTSNLSVSATVPEPACSDCWADAACTESCPAPDDPGAPITGCSGCNYPGADLRPQRMCPMIACAY